MTSMTKFKTILLTISLLALSAQASDRLLNSLKYRGFVNDFANVISAAEESRLTSMITELKQKTGAEIAVVTLSSLEGGQIDDFSIRLAERWKIGQSGKDNGLMFLAAMKDRKMRIEVGYGLEGAIPDATAGRIRRDVITPYFKAGKPGQGILMGIAALSQEVAEEYGVKLTGTTGYQPRSYQHTQRTRKSNPIGGIIFFIFFVYMAIRHPRLLLLMMLTSGRGGSRSGGGGGGGGFGGFSGGSFGGGGSSGGW